jgi:hypothetical protein
MIEEVVGWTGFMGKLIKVEVQQLIWEGILVGGEDEMRRGNWIAWKLCGVLCGVGC